MINAINIALSGLLASQKKAETAAANVANLTTNGSLEDTENAPYSALTTEQEALADRNGNGTGVKANVIPKNTPFVPAYDPGSPFADESGMIGAPNVDLAEEAINLDLAKVSFKANLKVLEAASALSDDLLHVFDDEA